MAVMRCLYVDDSKADRKRFERFLRSAWQRLRTPVELSVQTYATPDEAREAFTDNSFDLFLVDIMFSKETAGLALIREIRIRHPSSAIVGISIKADHREDALAAGADDFVNKTYVAGRDFLGEYLEKVIRGVLKAHGRDHLVNDEVEIVYDDRDLALAADLEDIGLARFAALAVPLVQASCFKIEVERVRPGFSGSVVFRAICHIRVQASRPAEVRDILVKVSRERELLSREVDRWGSVSNFPTGLFVQSLSSAGIIEAGGWFAIGAEFQRARTFFDWLTTSSAAAGKVEEVLQWLFVDSGLPALYDRQTTDTHRRPNEAILSIMTLSRRARTLDALKQLGNLSDRLGGADFQRARIVNALRFDRIGDIDVGSIAAGTQLCQSHGDLHTRNVLVGVHEHPRLIDPANIAVMPIYSDLARFVADLFVSAWDVSDRAYDVATVPIWLKAAQGLLDGSDMNTFVLDDDSNRPTAVALNWLCNNMAVVLKSPAPRWQWYLALAVEFMRCAYRSDLTHPKRILSLASASAALGSAERNVNV
jgi:CheY-like chemotaxis protein